MRGDSAPAAAHRGLTTATIICACVMQGLDTTIVNVCLPHIQGSMSASQDQISWILTSYIVASAITMPLTGWLAGQFGVKYIFLASVIGFTITSALCGAATSLNQLVLYRVMQGICSAGLVPLGRDLDRGDGRRAVFLPADRPHDDDGRALVPEPRTHEEPEFCRRQRPDVRGRDDPQRHSGADAVDDAGADELSGVRCGMDDGAARLRHDGGDVYRRAADQPGRQPPVHPSRVSLNRGLAVADDRVFAPHGFGVDQLRRF